MDMFLKKKGSRYGGVGYVLDSNGKMISINKIYQQNMKKLRPSNDHSQALQGMLRENQNYVNDVSLMRKPNSKKLQQSPGAKNKIKFETLRNDQSQRLNRYNKQEKLLKKNPLATFKRIDTLPSLLKIEGGKPKRNNGGNKKIHMGPNGGKYVMVRCDGKMKKRYLKKK